MGCALYEAGWHALSIYLWLQTNVISNPLQSLSLSLKMSGEGSGTPFPKVRAVYDYAAQSEKELSFRRGDLITIFDIVDDHWYTKYSRGE